MSDTLTLDAALGFVARDELPWERAWVADFQEFSDRFTLHDSAWIGVYLVVQEGNEAVLMLEWDSHWLPEPVGSECMEMPPSRRDPYLFIRITGIRSIRFHGFDEPISGRAVGGAVASSVESLKRLQVSDFADGTVDFRYLGRTEFLCIRPHDGSVVQLGNVKPRIEPPRIERSWWRFW